MEKLWKHSSLSTAFKIYVFNACIMSKVLHCLHTAWLNKNKLIGLPAQTLRIPHSFIKRVSNDEVVSRAQNNLFSRMLQLQQMMLFKGITDPFLGTS